MLYQFKVNFLKNKRGNSLWRKWKVFRKDSVGDYKRLPEFIKNYVFPGASFADIGCMWGVNGEYSFTAEEAGATVVKGVDVFGPTPEFEQKKKEKNSSVEFILGDFMSPETLRKIGVVDVVFCAGVLYHYPSPFDMIVALRKICGKTLILRTSAIPEVDGLPNAAVFYPQLTSQQRKLWNLKNLGLLRQEGITEAFAPEQGYGNWFWGITPSCLTSMLETAGFEIQKRFNEPFSQTIICKPVAIHFEHKLPDQEEARQMASEISASGIARPA